MGCETALYREDLVSVYTEQKKKWCRNCFHSEIASKFYKEVTHLIKHEVLKWKIFF